MALQGSAVYRSGTNDYLRNVGLHLEQKSSGIGRYGNAKKENISCFFKQEETMSISSDRRLKFVDQVTYLVSNISSAESYTWTSTGYIKSG